MKEAYLVRMTAHEMVIGLELMMAVDLLGSMLAEVSHRYVSCMIRASTCLHNTYRSTYIARWKVRQHPCRVGCVLRAKGDLDISIARDDIRPDIKNCD